MSNEKETIRKVFPRGSSITFLGEQGTAGDIGIDDEGIYLEVAVGQTTSERTLRKAYSPLTTVTPVRRR